MSPDAGATTQGPDRIHKMCSTIILVEFKHEWGNILSGRELRLRKTASSKLVVTFEISGKLVERNVINNLN